MIAWDFKNRLIEHFVFFFTNVASFLAPFECKNYFCARPTFRKMRISFNLKSPDAEKSPVRLIVTHKGRMYRRSIGVTVKTKQWKKGKNGQRPTSSADAVKLNGIRRELEKLLDEYSTPDEIELAMASVLGVAPPKGLKIGGHSVPTFNEAFREWSVSKPKSLHVLKAVYSTVMELMGDSYNWNNVDSSYYVRLVNLMNKRKFSKNYQGLIIACLKSVMSTGYKMKYHRNDDFRTFKVMHESVDSVYLTENEVDAICNISLESAYEDKARDMFVVGIYTASRFSDYSRLSYENIRDGRIMFTQQKTGGSVLIPLSPKVLAVLDKYGGRLPRIGKTPFNYAIKEVCRKAGIDTLVQVTRTEGAERITKTVPKWSLVSSHTARRTGATLMYKSGISTRQCMMITGHSTEASFRKYIRLTKEENADMLSDNPFFK